jgi:hypothetical protein
VDAHALFDTEVAKHQERAAKEGLHAAVRPNGLSDREWEYLIPTTFRDFPDVTFYDYTKCLARAQTALYVRFFPSNYTLVYSWSEKSDERAVRDYLADGGRVAMVFSGELPEMRLGFPVLDGDAHDFLPAWRRRCIVGLKAKGSLKRGKWASIAWLGDSVSEE